MSLKKTLTGVVVLAAFLLFIKVESQAAAINFAWDQVTTNSDGTPANDVYKYRVYISFNSSMLGLTPAQANANANIRKVDVLVTSLATPTAPEWTINVGPGSGALDLGAGNYYFRLTAVDNSSNESGFNVNATNQAAEITQNLQVPNVAPSVSVGSDKSVTMPNSITIDATVTDNTIPTGGALTQSWSKQSGPGTVTFGSPNSVDTTASFSAAGTYILRLTATDGFLSAFDEITVIVSPEANAAPQVSIAPIPTVVLPNSANLDATVTDDGHPIPVSMTLTWTRTSGPGTVTFGSPSAADTTASFSAIGIYTLRLTAFDGAATTFKEITVTVANAAPANEPPMVSAGSDLTITLPNSASLNGTVRDDGNPLPPNLTITWSRVSGPGNALFATPAEEDTTVTFSAPGTYILRLRASDGPLFTNDDITVTVNGPLVTNQAPVVDAGPATVNVQLPTNFYDLNGSATDDGLPTGGALTYAWTQLSGPAATFANAGAVDTRVTFTGGVGTYVLRLSVSDSQLVGRNDITINVSATANRAPVVSAIQYPAGADRDPGTASLQVNEGDTVAYSASATDADGDSLSYTWYMDGVVRGSGANFSYTYPAGSLGQTYSWWVAVNDGQGHTVNSSLLTVTVIAPGTGGGNPTSSISSHNVFNPVQGDEAKMYYKSVAITRDDVRVTIYDQYGHEVTEIEMGSIFTDHFIWNGRKRDGGFGAAGAYTALVKKPTGLEKLKLVLLK